MRTAIELVSVLVVTLLTGSCEADSWPCHSIIAPTNDLANQLVMAFDTASTADPINVCLTAGSYSGCASTSLQTLAGGPARIIGAGVNVTVIDCRGTGLDRLAIADISGAAIARLSVYGDSSPIIDVVDAADDFLLDSVFIQGDPSSGSAVETAGTGTLAINNCSFVGGGDSQLRTSWTTIVTNSTFVGGRTGWSGAAIWTSGDVTLLNCVLHNATASGDGGAVYSSGAMLVVNNTQITDTRAAISGGGLYVVSGSVRIARSLFERNTATGSVGGAGYFSYTVVAVNDTQVTDTRAASQGGGFYFLLGDALISQSLFERNTASGSAGGAVFSSGSAVMVTDTRVANTSAAGGGGGFYVYSGSLHVAWSTFEHNSAYSGGAMSVSGTTAVVSDTQVIDTATAGTGGGFSFTSSDAHLSRCRFERNTVSGSSGGGAVHSNGGAIVVSDTHVIDTSTAGRGGGFDVNYGSLHVSRSVFHLNTASHGGACSSYGATVVVNDTQFIDSSTNGRGGGFYAEFGTVHISRSRFVGSSASSHGGCGYLISGTLVVRDSVVVDCESNSDGGGFYSNAFLMVNTSIEACVGSDAGGLYLPGGSAEIVDCFFDSNSADAGGAVAASPGSVISISNSLFTNDKRGPIYTNNASVIVTDSDFMNNGCSTCDPLVNTLDGTSVTLIGCRFENNTASTALIGSTVAGGAADVLLQDCHFSGNPSPPIYLEAPLGGLDVVDTAFVNSVTDASYQVEVDTCPVTMTNVTVAYSPVSFCGLFGSDVGLFSNLSVADTEGAYGVYANGPDTAIVGSSFENLRSAGRAFGCSGGTHSFLGISCYNAYRTLQVNFATIHVEDISIATGVYGLRIDNTDVTFAGMVEVVDLSMNGFVFEGSSVAEIDAASWLVHRCGGEAFETDYTFTGSLSVANLAVAGGEWSHGGLLYNTPKPFTGIVLFRNSSSRRAHRVSFDVTGDFTLLNTTLQGPKTVDGVHVDNLHDTVDGTIEGLYLVDDNPHPGSRGVSLEIEGGDVSVVDALFVNTAPLGADRTVVEVYDGALFTLQNAVFVDTVTRSEPLVVLLDVAQVTMTDIAIEAVSSVIMADTDPTSICTLERLTVSGATGASGSALAVVGGGAVTVSNSTFSGCSASASGGAIEVTNGPLYLYDVRLSDNTATTGGAVAVSGEAASVNMTGCSLANNFARTAGAALMCVSSAGCYSDGGTVFARNSGSSTVYGLFLAKLHFVDGAFVDCPDGAVASYGAASLNLLGITFTRNGGSSVASVINTPLRVEDTVFRANSATYTLRVSSGQGSVVARTFISSNDGIGFVCDAPVAGHSVAFVDSVVCENTVDYECDSECDVSGAPNVCAEGNSTGCGDYCAENTEFCVADNGGVFAGPYDGCFECGGACDRGDYICPYNALCVDSADGGYTCACPSGFAGNGSAPCTDADECALGTDNCSPFAACANTPGSFSCTCDGGYSGNGVSCVDVDECGDGTHSCVAGAVCANEDGGHVCECDDTHYGPSGYVECTPCPANSRSFVGATNVTDCACDTNTFNIVNVVGADCVPCPAGRYVTDAGGGVLVCIECPADSYSDAPNTAGACTPCPPSTTTGGVLGSTSVQNCSCAESLDLVITANYTRCERDCPAGTSRPEPDSPCNDCPIGRYSDQPNLAECLPCPPNSLTAGVGSVSVANCTCVSGYAAPVGGAVGADCERWCPAGSYRPSPFSLDCPVCDIGSFSDEPNVGACTPCPNNAVTPTSNSTAITDCECPPNYYTPERERGTACRPCPSGAKCRGGMNWPVARKGYMYVEGDDGTAGFAECVPFEACAGNGQCAEGYTGDLCERCKPNYYRLDGLCYECQNNAWLIVLACGLALFLFCAVLVWFNSQDRAINKFASIVIGVNALQIAGMYGRLNLNWPPLAQRFFAVLSLVNFNIELVSPECAVSVNDPFVLRWLLTMFFPVLVVAIFASIAGIGSLLMMVGACGYDAAVSKWNPRYLRHTCIRAFYQLMTIGYLPLSAAVFEFFYCVKDASGVRVISTARQTVCYTPTYWGLFLVALFCFALYPVGVPLFCGFLLQRKRERLGEFKFSLRYGFLVGRFTSQFYYFELVVMARKLGVALTMSFLTDNPYVKAAGAVVVLVLALTVQLRLAPYRTKLYDGLEVMCLVTSTFILLASVIFQAGGTEEVTRTVIVVLLLCVLLVVISGGLALDGWKVLRSERALNNAGLQSVEDVYNTNGSDTVVDQFDELAMKAAPAPSRKHTLDSSGATPAATTAAVCGESGGSGGESSANPVYSGVE